MSIIKKISGASPPSRKMMSLHNTTYGPTGLWQFANGAVLNDSSGNSATLTQDGVHGAATEVGGIQPNNQALQDFIYYRNATDEFQYTGAMSVAFLFRADKYTHSGGDGWVRFMLCYGSDPVPDNNRFAISVNPTGYITYEHKNSGTTYTFSLSQLHYDLYRWHHLAFTRSSNGRTITIYLDGQQIHQETLDVAPGSGDDNKLNIGGLAGYNGGAYDGITLSSVVIFDKELSSDQIAHIGGRCLGY